MIINQWIVNKLVVGLMPDNLYFTHNTEYGKIVMPPAAVSACDVFPCTGVI